MFSSFWLWQLCEGRHCCAVADTVRKHPVLLCLARHSFLSISLYRFQLIIVSFDMISTKRPLLRSQKIFTLIFYLENACLSFAVSRVMRYDGTWVIGTCFLGWNRTPKSLYLHRLHQEKNLHGPDAASKMPVLYLVSVVCVAHSVARKFIVSKFVVAKYSDVISLSKEWDICGELNKQLFEICGSVTTALFTWLFKLCVISIGHLDRTWLCTFFVCYWTFHTTFWNFFPSLHY